MGCANPRLINLRTPWRRVFPEKLTDPHLIKKIPAFYGTRRFITTFTTSQHLSLSWTKSIQSMPPFHFWEIDFNIIIPPTPGSSERFPSHGFHHWTPVRKSITHTSYMPCPSQSSWFDHPNDINQHWIDYNKYVLTTIRRPRACVKAKYWTRTRRSHKRLYVAY
jgi:hypothetical protein